jgi:hypothetical protein
VSAGTDDDLGRARAEVRQLREMIDVLRTELEAAGEQLVMDRQRGAAEREAERRQAREGVNVLRERLESAFVERNAAVQAVIAQSADELAQLKATVEALRSALIAAHEDAAQARDERERAFRAERQQLHEIIATLRARLELSDAG